MRCKINGKQLHYLLNTSATQGGLDVVVASIESRDLVALIKACYKMMHLHLELESSSNMVDAVCA